MSWQDELRRLDEELASGRISADDYRSRRDQIMSSAVSQGSQPASGTTPGEATTMLTPVTPPGQDEQGQQGQQGQGGDADKTQIVSNQDMGDSDRTQTVGGWRATPPGDDSGRTQVVPGVPGVPPQAQAGAWPVRPAPPPNPSPPGGFPQPNYPPNQPPWQAEEDFAPPWAGQEFPPLAAAGTPDWARQGPEVFDTEKKSGGMKVFGIIAIVVVLLGVAAGAYFLFRPDDSTRNTGDSTNEEKPPATSEAPPTSEKPKGPIAELPGEASDMGDVDTFPKVVALNYLDKQEIAIYQQGGARTATIAISTENDIQLIVLVTEQTSPAAAVTARDQLDALQRKFKLAKVADSPAGVLTGSNPNASRGPILRAHYASGNKVVRVQAQGENAEEVTQLFEDVLDAELERLPADG
ncbi:MAG: hypothetical protein GEV28_13540 [Actinophytocola sp.]|uniref:hypothetical protein n=1 Tax=Actinophytocola sp. TaxID=1872138 RepID=UPI001321482A|nr:hypothetical protein [Actinophytocola sp.]MPZ81360.1 hypothetical protein [Actinophytocola sp.]